MWTNEEVSNWFLCGEMQPAAVQISELLVAGPGLETDMEALCHQQETLQGFLDGAAAEGHWYEERDAADRLDAVERQIADRISAAPVTDDWGTLGNRLQKWAERQYGEEIGWFQQDRAANCSVPERFNTMHKEVPRWKSISRVNRLILHTLPANCNHWTKQSSAQ
jgi:hypothetical protein